MLARVLWASRLSACSRMAVLSERWIGIKNDGDKNVAETASCGRGSVVGLEY
jgi:hypothetical protein